jgi:hypothetical protein
VLLALSLIASALCARSHLSRHSTTLRSREVDGGPAVYREFSISISVCTVVTFSPAQHFRRGAANFTADSCCDISASAPTRYFANPPSTAFIFPPSSARPVQQTHHHGKSSSTPVCATSTSTFSSTHSGCAWITVRLKWRHHGKN